MVRLIAVTSIPPGPENVISSLKPFCLRSKGKMSFSEISPATGWRRIE